MINGSPKFDGLAIGNIEADFTKQTIQLKAVAGFVNTTTGDTHGWTRGEGGVWSTDTLQRLKELREAMERDLANLHFEGAVKKEAKVLDQGSPGIGEFLGDAPSV